MCLGLEPGGGRLEGADESTQPWRQPLRSQEFRDVLVSITLTLVTLTCSSNLKTFFIFAQKRANETNGMNEAKQAV